MEIPFAFGSKAFSYISSSCVLTVPAGTRDAYIAKGWTEDVFEGGVVEASKNIVFADANVKALCVANWDTNGDGELSEAEAAAVTDLGTVFQGNTTIQTFDELQYFTGLTSIGNYAFCDCPGLTSVTIPSSVTSIGVAAFRVCSGLTSVIIPESVTSIGGHAFYNCAGLAYITVEIGNTIYDSRDNCNAIIETATNTLISGCKSTVIPNSVTSIGVAAFFHCSGLTSVTIPNSVTSIGVAAFSGCSGLTSVTIGSSVTSIGSNAFYGCSGLTSVVAEMETPFAFGDYAFSSIGSSCTLTVPAGTRDAYIAAGWTEDVFKGGIIEAPAPNIDFADANVKALCVANWDTNGDGELSEAEAAAVTDLGEVFKGNTTIQTFDELQYFTGLTSIGDNTFDGCRGLTSVTIGSSVTYIGERAFGDCSGLTSVTIPSSVTSIGEHAFNSCSGLTSMKVASGNPVYDSRDNCNAIIETATNTLISGCKSTVFPNSVTSIGESAFYNCSGLTSVTIPNSVTSIGMYAFYGCSV